jgi:hypothetical protein
VHHSKKVTAWVADHNEAIEVFYLPSHSPERHPDEYLNGDLKRHIHMPPEPPRLGSALSTGTPKAGLPRASAGSTRRLVWR